MKIRATIGHPKGDFQYFTGPTGAVLDRNRKQIGSFRYVGHTTQDPRRTKTGVWETWSKSSIKGSFSDGRTFTGTLTYLPGFIGNSDEGEIVISETRAPSFQRNADTMVWKTDEGHTTVLIRGTLGWHKFSGNPKAGRPITATGHRYVAFSADPFLDGKRVPISTLPKSDLIFFRAYVAAAK